MISVTLRKTLKKDWDLILKLRNSDEFRTYFYNQHIISKKEHYDYLTKQKNNPNIIIPSISNYKEGSLFY